MKFQPLGDRVLVEIILEEEKHGGLYLPNQPQENKLVTGKVIAVGEGKTTPTGELLYMTLEVGDVVVFWSYSGVKVDDTVKMFREEEIVGVVNAVN